MTCHRAGPPMRPALRALLRRARRHGEHGIGPYRRAGGDRPAPRLPTAPLVHRSRPRLRRTVAAAVAAGPAGFPAGPVCMHPRCAGHCRAGHRSLAGPPSVRPPFVRPLSARPAAVAGRFGAVLVLRTSPGAAVGGRPSATAGTGASRRPARPAVAAGPVGAGPAGAAGAPARVLPGPAAPAVWRGLGPHTRHASVRGPGAERSGAGTGTAGRTLTAVPRTPSALARARTAPARISLVFTRTRSAPAPAGGRHPEGATDPANPTAGPGPAFSTGHRPHPSASSLTASDVPQLVERVVREIDRRMQARLERRGRP